MHDALRLLHTVLNLRIGGEASDLWWVGLRVVVALIAGNAWNAIRGKGWWGLPYVLAFLSVIYALKDVDDLAHSNTAPLTLYFLASNTAFCILFTGLARRFGGKNPRTVLPEVSP